jgi:uncharacterized phage-like protein YoqJ
MATQDLVICGTGHRPKKIVVGAANAYDPHVFGRLVDLASAALIRVSATLVISGMAIGWDMALAEAALRVGRPFDAYVPFRGQEGLWPEESKRQYSRLLAAARNVVVVCPGTYAAWKMQRRNESMVDAAGRVLALWNGTRGGTANCVAYANQVGRPVMNLWSSWERYAAPA